jgi:hypothetical protein
VLLPVETESRPVAVGERTAPSPSFLAHRPATHGDILRLRECQCPDSTFARMVTEHAVRSEVDARALGVRTLLHLPRIATPTGSLTRSQVAVELSRAATQLKLDERDTADLVPTTRHALHELHFERIPAAKADRILSSLHYLRSARPGSLTFALLDPVHRLPVSLCSVSPLEWRRVGSYIYARFGIPQARIWDVSRVYSSEVAPANAISFLLARVRSALRRSGEHVDLLTTAVDPNLGFTGASYRAANWRHWLTIQPRPYLYHNRRYVSPRQLRQRFSTSNLADLRAAHPRDAFERSRVRLLDSLIFCLRLHGQTETVPPDPRGPLHR